MARSNTSEQAADSKRTRSLEGSVYKKGDVWFARVRYTDSDGRRREKKRTCDTLAQAKTKKRDLIDEIANEAAGRKTYRDLDKYFRREYVHTARFVGGKRVSGYRTTLSGIRHYLDGLLDHFGDKWIDEITYSDLYDLKRDLETTPIKVTDDDPIGRPRSVSETNHFLRYARRIFNVAIEQGWLTVNPFKRGRPLIQNSFETERTRILTADEETRLLAACTGKREHLRPLIIFALETACRRGEINALRWSAVDLKQRTIRIDAANSKTLKERLVPITNRLRETLVQLRGNTLNPNARVFQTGDTKKAFHTARTAAGLPDIHFHDLRHTAITRMLQKNIPQALVMKISGHTQIKTFLRYVNQTPESIFEIAKKLDEVA